MANIEHDYKSIYINLPALLEGFKYFTLSELVANLEERIDYSAFYFTEGPSTDKYIRPSHLFTDFRNCLIDYDSIAVAPVRKDIHFDRGKGGSFASFVDGQMRVGRICLKDNAKPIFEEDYVEEIISVDDRVYHFSLKSNGYASSEFILKELLSEYVNDQAKRICALTGLNYLRSTDFGYLKIAVPSLEKQDLIIANERFTTKQLDDVLEIIDAYFDDNGKVESQNILQRIFSALYNNSDFDSHIYYNPIRRVLEWMFRAACEKGLLHDKCFNNKDYVNLSDCYLFLAGKPAIHSGVICRKAHFPVIIANNVKYILDITGGGSHTTIVSENDNPNLTAYWANIGTPYLLYSITFMLCDILIWFGQYVHDNADVDKNRALWRDLVLDGKVKRDGEGLYVGDCKLKYSMNDTCEEGDYIRVTKARENERQYSSHLLIAEKVARWR